LLMFLEASATLWRQPRVSFNVDCHQTFVSNNCCVSRSKYYFAVQIDEGDVMTGKGVSKACLKWIAFEVFLVQAKKAYGGE
jgi:hypothetical protein